MSRLRSALVRLLVLALLFAGPASAVLAAIHGPDSLTPDGHAAAAMQDDDHGHSYAIDGDLDPPRTHTHDHNPADHFHEAARPAAFAAVWLRAATGAVYLGPEFRPEPGPCLALERPPRC
jgi:hypothetical protein